MERTAGPEEPISPELVLVDEGLASRAREASTDSPWLLPAVEEARQRERLAPAAAAVEVPAPAAEASRRPPRPPFSRHIRSTVAFGLGLVGFVAGTALVLELAPGSAKPTLVTKSAEPAPPPAAPAESAAKPKAPAPANVQRVFRWRGYRGAVYYEFHLQRGARTIYAAQTLKPTATLPALKLKAGMYHVIVRPAIPGDAGIVLGRAILDKTLKI